VSYIPEVLGRDSLYTPIVRLLNKLEPDEYLCNDISTILESIPAYSPQYIECRLGEPDGVHTLDYLFGIDNSFPLSAYPLTPKHRAIFKNIKNTMPAVLYFWLEYDNILARRQARIPSLHVCVDPSYQSNCEDITTFTNEEQYSVLTLLAQEGTFPHQTMSYLIRIINNNSRLIHMSYMHGRTPSCIKLYIQVRLSSVISLLKAINWPGNYDQLYALLEKRWLKPRTNELLHVDLKVERSLTSYIGIVHSRITLNQKSDGAERIQSLIEEGILSEDQKILCVLAWLDRSSYTVSQRWVDIKTSLLESGHEQSKLYFGIQNTTTAMHHKLQIKYLGDAS